ncbi:MAG: DarT ssDNA thymidine ADP-ribosyltransferase family protein [Candidatus Oxydemutatoraceae bacterium WSBS_2016_MAG_OTU14]
MAGKFKPTSGRGCKDGKQAEFLLEQDFPWHLVEGIGVHSQLTITK